MQVYKAAVTFMAEDPTEMGPDEVPPYAVVTDKTQFFGNFDQFIVKMSEARADLATFKRKVCRLTPLISHRYTNATTHA